MDKKLAIDEDYQGAKWLSAKEAAQYLRLKNVGTIRNMVCNGDLPKRKPFGKLLFKRTELDLIIEQSRKG